MDILDDDEVVVPTDDIDFDVNVDSIKPTNSRKTPGVDPIEVEDELPEDEEESFEDKRARELEELEEGDDYLFNMDELEQ